MNTSKRWKVTGVVLAALIGLSGAKAYAATNPVDATITVTPLVTVDLAIAPTTYAYGSLDVNTSSVAAIALTLTNNSNGAVTIQKHIQTQSNPAGWTADTSAAGANQYVLLVATSAARPTGSGDFVNARHAMAVGSGNMDALYGAGGTGSTPTLAATGAVDLWFKLVMPTSVSASTARGIGVQFTGTAL